MGGLVTSRGWVELHNPSSCKISLRMFSINICSATAGSSKMEGKEGYLDDIVELGDFKLTLRALSVAASFAVPWNMSYLALENFLLPSNFCSADFGPAENQALCLTQFVDYVLGKNSNRWRDSEPFHTTGDLKATWDTFFANSGMTEVEGSSRQAGIWRREFRRSGSGIQFSLSGEEEVLQKVKSYFFGNIYQSLFNSC
jgi:hypothetical protein